MTDDLFDSANSPGAAILDDAGVKRDGYGRYLLPKPGAEARGDRAWTRATTFAKSISDTYVLSMWGQRMVAKGLAMRPDLYALAASTPLTAKAELDQLTERAKEAAGAKTRASLGTALHAFTEQVDRGESPEIPEPWDRDVAAYRATMEAEGFEVLPHLIERIVVCEHYAIAGTFDRILRLTKDYTARIGDRTHTAKAGEYVIGDLKTGRDLSYGWNEIVIQLAIYANADGIWNGETGKFEPMPPVRKDFAIVLHLPVEEANCTVYDINIEEGWKAAYLCARVREWRRVRQLASPHGVIVPGRSRSKAPTELSPDKVESVRPVVAELSWLERINVAASAGELSVIRREALARREWTDDLLTAGLARLRALETA